jgi:hypothetical protein
MERPMNIHDPNVVVPKVTTGPLPASRKVYSAPEAAPDLKVPHREIKLSEASGEAPLPVYDTTGPYTDDTIAIDVEKGLPRHRIEWVKERGGVEEYEGRPIKPVDNGNVSGKHLARNFPNTPKPWRAISPSPLVGEGGARSAPGEGGARGKRMRKFLPPHPSPLPPGEREQALPGRRASTPSPNTNGRSAASSPRR